MDVKPFGVVPFQARGKAAMRSMRRISRLRLLLVALMSLLMTVAVGCLAIPIFNEKGPDSLSDSALQFLEAGGATRADVLRQLGEPNWRVDDYRIFAYDGVRHIGEMHWGYWIPVPGGPTGDGVSPMQERKTVYIAFDERGQVVAHTIWKLPLIYIGTVNIRYTVERWARKEHFERINLEFAVPPDRSGIIFFRTGRWRDINASIQVDGLPIAQLQVNTYLPMLVDPGRHDVHVVPINSIFLDVDKRKSPMSTSIATSSGGIVYLRVSFEGSGVKLKKYPEPEARKKLGKLGLIGPPPAYAGW
jgi:hypothetical protein